MMKKNFCYLRTNQGGSKFPRYCFSVATVTSILVCQTVVISQSLNRIYRAKFTPATHEFFIRETPDMLSPLVTTLKDGDILVVMEQREDEWRYVILASGKKGWVRLNPSASEVKWELVPLSTRPEENETPNSPREPQPQQKSYLYEELLRHVLALEKRVSVLEAKVLTAATAVPPIAVLAKPSDQEVEEAVRTYLKREVPISWVGNLMGGENAEVDLVEIKTTGVYNEQQRYWPMRIRCIGSCSLRDPFNPGRIVTFDRVGDFVLYKDDYGKWKAELKGGLFQ